MHPFPFFVGTNGSGTTLHRAIFDSHPDLAILGESHFIVSLARHRRRYERPGGFIQLAADLRQHPRFDSWNLPIDRFEERLGDLAEDDYASAIRLLYRLYAEERGKKRYGDKTQAYIHHLPFLSELFPEARFVHVVRDGRDVALAHAEGARIEQVAFSWRRRVREGHKAGQALGPERYIESRFEELVGSPEAAVRKLCEFLDLEFHPDMLRYYERASEIVATTAKPSRHRDIFLPPTKGLRDWRRELTSDQVLRFEAIAGGVLDDLGYGRAFDSIPTSKKIAAVYRLVADTPRRRLKKKLVRLKRR